ncbi:MAG: 50S ribosomal protein L22 [Desulfobacteraceae bacterium IS3]|jgi:large subunit ribosomal protein L22|nr:MAG: 50S ribosomal protein L22 [Desulfobacteraceae bacterium IS3]HAO22056.1 50S ribosomal protein L22 [Desulfobacteraceae bacterium]
MEVRALLRYARISPQKVRKIVGAVKGKPVQKGLEILKFLPQKSAGLLEKIVRSAVANADQNANLDVDSLVIQNITADQGPVQKRFMARARGRGTRIVKRTSHITVVLAEGAGVK